MQDLTTSQIAEFSVLGVVVLIAVTGVGYFCYHWYIVNPTQGVIVPHDEAVFIANSPIEADLLTPFLLSIGVVLLITILLLLAYTY